VELELFKRLKLFEDLFGDDISTDSLTYTLLRDRYDKTFLNPLKAKSQFPGNIKEMSVDGNEVRIKFENISLSLFFLEDTIVKVVWQECRIDTLLNRIEPCREPIEAFKDGNSYRIRLAKQDLELVIESDGTLKFYFRDKLVRTDFPPELAGNASKSVARLRTSSAIYGLGEKALGLNQRGTRSLLWNHDANGLYGPGDDPLYLNIPVYIDIQATEGYFIFYNNPSRAVFDLCSTERDIVNVSFEGLGLEYYIGFGNLAEIMKKYSSISGKPLLPPKWSLGFHQSRYSYMDQAEIEKVAEGFKKNDLPISAIHMDIDYMDGYRIFTTNKGTFPDLQGLSRSLMDDNIRLVSIIDPGVKIDVNYDIYQEVISRNLAVRVPDGGPLNAPVWAGMSVFPDFSNAETRKWWGGKYTYYLDNGISGFWHDMNEPAAFTLWGDNTLPDTAELSAGKHAYVHNLYGLLMDQAGYEGLISLRKEERPFILSRSGWAGVQKFAFVWTGDSASTWAEMHSSISTIINLGLSGIPFVGTDIGGFSGSPSDELFLRWFQMGSFFPFFRVHSAKGTRMREPWLFGETYLQIIRKFLKLRYQLIPFYYTLAYESHITGSPIVRPVLWEDPQYDPSVDSVFLIGDSIFIAPVLTQNQKNSVINFPEGMWYSLWDKSLHSSIEKLDITLDEIPAFIKAGSILPTEINNEIIMEVYFADICRGTLYIDDGSMNQKYLIYHFSCYKKDGKTELSVSIDDHGYPGLKVLKFKFHGVKLNSTETEGTKILKGKNILEMPGSISKAIFH
jgi:alpha-glucosidase